MKEPDLTKYFHYLENLLLVAPADAPLNRLMHLVALTESQVGFISEDFPLLSNLDVGENITLGSMYEQNLSLNKAMRKIEPHADALNMTKFLDKRKQFLTKNDLFRAYFLRCVASNNSIILMETPYISHLRIIFDCMGKVQYKIRLWVSCHEGDKEVYSKFPLKEVQLEV